ncbi:hypothetical protein QQ045_011933 [Rhodiola kirilowii]
MSNIMKIIRNLSPADKDEAMKTIIFESDVRANDPLSVCRAQQAHQAKTKNRQQNNEQQHYLQLQLQPLKLGGNNDHGEEENNARSGEVLTTFLAVFLVFTIVVDLLVFGEISERL